MKRTILLFTIILFTICLPQSNIQSFINRVDSIPDVNIRQVVVDSFLNFARTKGIPFIEDGTANFIYVGKDSVTGVKIAGDFNNWGKTSWNMNKLVGTNLYYLSKEFEPDARLDYKLIVESAGNVQWILDPENPNQIYGGFGINSELAMPGYIQPWEIKFNPDIKLGITIPENIHSNFVNTDYQVTVYLPPDYDSLDSKNYPSVYFQDGSEYINLGSAINVIDNLIDSNKLKPIIAVFVRPNDRNNEYAFLNKEKYIEFFVKELTPYIDKKYKTIPESTSRLVLGDSYGGHISLQISYNHPDVFANCGQHSSVVWTDTSKAAKMIFNGVTKQVKIYSIWGKYEPVIADMWKPGIKALKQKEYIFDWKEYPEGHSWGLWRATLDDMLIYFFPSVTSIK